MRSRLNVCEKNYTVKKIELPSLQQRKCNAVDSFLRQGFGFLEFCVNIDFFGATVLLVIT